MWPLEPSCTVIAMSDHRLPVRKCNDTLESRIGSGPRYMICVTLFMHVARVKKHSAMRESHAKRETFQRARNAWKVRNAFCTRNARAILAWPCSFLLEQLLLSHGIKTSWNFLNYTIHWYSPSNNLSRQRQLYTVDSLVHKVQAIASDAAPGPQ